MDDASAAVRIDPDLRIGRIIMAGEGAQAPTARPVRNTLLGRDMRLGPQGRLVGRAETLLPDREQRHGAGL